MITGSSAIIPGLLSLLQSCQQQERLSWQPQFLSQDQVGFVATLVDTILPKTETPGGLEVKVDIFIDLVFSKMYGEEAQKMVVEEIEALDIRCRGNYGASFSGISAEDRVTFLTELEGASPKYNGQVWGTAVGTQEPVGFYRTLKSLLLWGYFSSEEIGKNVLSYDPIPGDYLGCIPLSDVGNTWSL